MGDTADLQLYSTGPAAPSARVAIELSSVPVLSYALAHNGIPVVSQLTLTGGSAPVRNASVHLGIRDAEGPIGAPVELLADVDPGRTTVLTHVGLRLDPAAMLQVEERRPGWLTVSVEQDGAVLGSTRQPVTVLAAAQWLATPLSLALEMLAAHVQPNHPAITTLVGEAAELLGESTGSPSIQGYQAGADRVDAIAAAVCEAMQRREVRYSEPPASWADVGQKVRTPGESWTAGSAPAWTRSSSSLPRWSRPASGRCYGWSKGTPSSATGARRCPRRAPRPPTSPAWST
ncbi:hypothetical protein SAMN05661080_04731 [Modestobacter sp. DSM 44400]|uniref:hypothetical protein n=1 Tax=Modestobacter sp. DSM 44400 TaxID=1550230 RepID=UPI000899A2BB|nr:hypothetical protein [Modestobacter sp. DSM 44400]SDY82747.1 hypothetical protein SAMN05661080_04731 [Modestobacter sp. DSM 44400]